MNKEFNLIDNLVQPAEIASDDLQSLDDLALAMVGGGECPVAL